MSQSPVDDLTMRGYQTPRNVQFNVFLDNRVGKMVELVELLESHALRLAALSVVDSNDYGVIRLVASNAELARRLLRRAGLPFSETEILLVQLRAGQSLGQLCRSLLAAEVNILYAYPLLIVPHGQPAIALHTDDQTLTCQVLCRKQFVMLGETDLRDPGDLPPAPGAGGGI